MPSLKRATLEGGAFAFFTIGAIAAFVGIVFLRHAVAERYGSGDWVRVLYLPVGIGFLVTAARALLARPRQPSHVRRWGRRGLTLVVAVLAVFFVIVPVSAAIWLTQKPRDPVHPAPFAVPHLDVTLRTSDGVTLRGWYVPSRNRAAIVLVHGAGGNRDGVRRHALMLIRHGFGVLLYDARGRGESSGKTEGMGWTWQPDVAAALDYVAHRPDVDPSRIGGLGLSNGAEVLLQAAAHDQRLRAVVADGAIARSMADVRQLPLSEQLEAVPYWGVAFGAMRVLRAGSPPPPLASLVPRIAPRPALIVASGRGMEQELGRIYARAGGPTNELWELPDVEHTHGLRDHPNAYDPRVAGFFAKALLGSRTS